MKRIVKPSSPKTHLPQGKTGWQGYYRILLGLRDRLLEQKRDHLDQVAEPLEPHSLSLADSATDEFDHNLAFAELSAQQDALYEVEQALHRILDGTFGICQETGKPIRPERLRAMPWTRFCRESAEKLERAGRLPGVRLGTVASVRKRVAAAIKEPAIPGQEAF